MKTLRSLFIAASTLFIYNVHWLLSLRSNHDTPRIHWTRRNRGLMIANHGFTTYINVTAALHWLASIPNALICEFVAEEETNLRAQLLLDVSGSMGYRHRTGLSKLEYASYLTAVLAYLMMRQQDAVGLNAFDTQLRLDMPPRSAPRHFDEMMHQVEALQPGKKTGSMDRPAIGT